MVSSKVSLSKVKCPSKLLRDNFRQLKHDSHIIKKKLFEISNPSENRTGISSSPLEVDTTCPASLSGSKLSVHDSVYKTADKSFSSSQVKPESASCIPPPSFGVETTRTVSSPQPELELSALNKCFSSNTTCNKDNPDIDSVDSPGHVSPEIYNIHAICDYAKDSGARAKDNSTDGSIDPPRKNFSTDKEIIDLDSTGGNSMELPFFSAARVHPPFACPDPGCFSCKKLKNGQNEILTIRESSGTDPPTTHSGAATPVFNNEYSFFESHTGDPNRSERSQPPPGYQSLYTQALGKNYVTYPGTLPPVRTEPSGILYPPCMPAQKAAWFVRSHSFHNETRSSITENSVEDIDEPSGSFDLSALIGPFFCLLLCIFYIVLGSGVESIISQVVLSCMAISHICSLYMFNIEHFQFIYHDCLQAFFVHIGYMLETLFDSIYCSFNYVFGDLSPPPYIYNLYMSRFKKSSKSWPKLLYRKLRKNCKAFICKLCSFIYLAGFHYPKMSASVSRIQLHHINFKNLPQSKSKQLLPNPINKGIPVFFENGLPFVSASVNGTMVKFLIDTGSQFNILNKNIIRDLESNCVDYTKFRHDLLLSGHSGQPLNIDEQAVKIPIKFMGGQHMFSPHTLQLPFLIEDNPGAVSILGMNSLRKLNIMCSTGLKHLFLEINEDVPTVGYPSEGLSYPGTISPTCDMNQTPYLEIRFQDLDTYTGCILINNSFSNDKGLSKDIETLNGHFYHVQGGTAKVKSPFKPGFNHTGIIQVSGTVATCTHPDPGGNEILASLTAPHGYAPGLGEERERDLTQDSLLYDKVFKENTLNHTSADPDANPDPMYSPLFDWDLPNDFNINITVPSKNHQTSLSTNFLEIQIKDNENNCFLCLENKCQCTETIHRGFDLCVSCSKCICSTNPQAKLNLKYLRKNEPRIFINHNLITLYVFHPDDIYKNLFALSKKIIHLMPAKNFDEVRLGCTLGSSFGTKIFSKLSHSLSRAQEGCPDTPITLIPTAKQTVIHALEFDVEKGQLVHRPLLMNDTIGLEPDLLQPPEINYLLDSYDSDLTEVINNSSGDFKDFLKTTFSTFNNAYIKGPTDYGELILDTFRLDLELKPDTDHLLPKHKPFSTSAHLTKIVDKICRFWETIKLARPSEISSHASRLLVVTKKISNRAFEKIKGEVESNTNYRFRTNNPAELYALDPDLLTIKHINSIFRVCLDSRDLNRISRDMVQRSQNPETTLYNLMLSIGGADSSTTKKYSWAELRATDPFRHEKFSKPDPDYTFIDKLIASDNFSKDKHYYYSTLDISSAHTSIPLTERAKFLLNFITPSMKIMQFQRAVFGLKNISSQFNGSLCRILEDLITRGLVHVYADDLILICKHRETHLALIAEIARRFENHGLKISLTKSNFGVEKFTYLGFVFDQNGISLGQDRINSLTNFPPPKDIKGVQRFLGAVNYIQRFIPQYSFNLFPITLLLSEKDFFWHQEQQSAFDAIKKQISSNLCLHYVPPKTQLHLFVDASLVAGGGVLFCGVPNTPSYKPVLYMSKKFSDHEIRRHSALESEMHNLLYCLEKCSYFFTSLDTPVIVHTDAKTILYLIFGARKTSNPKLSRLALKLSGYLVHYSINYTKPTCPEMIIADCLSRQYYNMVPKLPGDLIKVIKKEDILLPNPGVYNFEQLDDWVDQNKVIKEENYPEKVLKIHSIKNQDPDHFSLIHLIDWDQLSEFQRKDPFVASIFNDFSPKEILESTPKNGYLVRNNILYVENKLEPLFPKIYIPDSLLHTVVAGAHIAYNHIGAHKHFELLKTLISNPNLKKVVFDLVGKCHLCAVVNCDTNRKGMISKIRFPDFPGQTISIDFMTVPKDFGYEAILVILDLFSNYCVLEPCKNQSTDSAINALERAFRYIGFPREIRADGQKSLLKAKAMKKFLKKHRVKAEIYPPYYKYHNASCERQIRNIRAILRTQNSVDQNFKWFKNLTNTMTVLNAVPRKFRHGGTTRFLSPFEIYFGRQRQLIKIDDYDEFPLNPQPTSLMNSPLRNFTRGAMLALKNDFRLSHNKKARELVIKPGDFYLVQNNKTPMAGRLPLKYQPRFLPNIFLCKQVSGRNVLGLDIILGNANYSSLDHVKLYKPREDYFSSLPDPIKNHFGSSLDLKLSLDARKIILEKLKKVGMYQNIIEPALTLTSPAPQSSSASGTHKLEMLPKLNSSISENQLSTPIVDNVSSRGIRRRSPTFVGQPDNPRKENNENSEIVQPPPPDISLVRPVSENARKKRVLKKLGRMANYINPFDPPLPPRVRKPPDKYQAKM